MKILYSVKFFRIRLILLAIIYIIDENYLPSLFLKLQLNYRQSKLPDNIKSLFEFFKRFIKALEEYWKLIKKFSVNYRLNNFFKLLKVYVKKIFYQHKISNHLNTKIICS